ncbi:ankyrin repeat domain-containing protein [Aspergillus fischeri NRRL 181]|uniref:Uncharacterized protein n=1 Tax=Neosartorya fischeri (strain ATCC 1020 / DSM 3700 / CBS 544.65 / FGSC A1164 / JCM 1740 / NRRL 181 / WB 181) TaxID=331117 RepID=A1DAQ4_NEOFI|nr:uncharacterized protein NFIA_095640 [Aspergillus fischeri NRRL 181]EAW19944.1 hypothetical protein NFIA_095640 [Aspergillus fischeri NRRL 181]
MATIRLCCFGSVVRNLSVDVLRQLLELGLDPNAYSKALQQGHPSIRKHLAVTDGNAEVAELLLCHGADPNMRTGPFSSVLSLAIAKGHVEVADVLLKHCAKEKCKEMDVDEEDYLAGMVELLSSA